jgi:hypothetical protein
VLNGTPAGHRWEAALAHGTAHYGGSPPGWGTGIRLYRLAASWMAGYAFGRERLLAARARAGAASAPP